LEASNGQLYGMTVYGGHDSSGTIFSYDLGTNNFTKIYDFDSLADGYHPQGSLMQAKDGRLYGLVTSEGSQAKLFQFDLSTNTMVLKANVTGTPYYTALLEIGVNPLHTKNSLFTSSIRLFPNPVNATLYIDRLTNLKIDALDIINILGKTERRIPALAESIDVAELESGIYLLRISSENQVHYVRFVKS
jgi:uncharacterized repeat protein (TIGR03803 family)